jgi:hypothetical protein
LTKTIATETFSITVDFFDQPKQKGEGRCGSITSKNLHGQGLNERALDRLEVKILNHACAGINIEAKTYVREVISAVDALRQANEIVSFLEEEIP